MLPIYNVQLTAACFLLVQLPGITVGKDLPFIPGVSQNDTKLEKGNIEIEPHDQPRAQEETANDDVQTRSSRWSRKLLAVATPKAKVKPEMCDVVLGSGDVVLALEESLSCRHIVNMGFLLEQMTESITTLEIVDSNLPSLNFTIFHEFHKLQTISVINSGLILIEGQLPMNVVSVNFSRNSLSPSSIGKFFSWSEFNNVEIIDLSYNWEEIEVELPKSIFTLPSLKSLYLAGNQLEGHFVWSTMWDWVSGVFSLLKDADDALCVFPKHHKVFSLLGCLKAKTDVEDTCSKVDKHKCSSCVLYALQKDLEVKFPGYPISDMGKHGSTAISLELDCSNKSLTTFPIVPIQTWKVDISYNMIEDLSPIKASPYVIYLDATNNSVRVESLIGSPFLDDFMSLSLQSNHIQHIPSSFLAAVRNVQNNKNKNKGDTFLGGNYLQCDCTTATETKGLLNSMRNPDWKDIFCGNKKYSGTDEYLPLKDLKMFDVCIIHKESNPDQEIWIYLIIGVEGVLILFILGKVWYDQRSYRRTRKLPWCSQKMPRLPCDAILEGIKDRRIANPVIASTHSTHHSQSSVHRSNSGVGCRSIPGSISSRTNTKIPLVQFNLHCKTSRSNSDTSNDANHSVDMEDSKNLLTTGRR